MVTQPYLIRTHIRLCGSDARRHGDFQEMIRHVNPHIQAGPHGDRTVRRRGLDYSSTKSKIGMLILPASGHSDGS